MVDPLTTRRWGYRLLFLGLALLVVFFQILPVTFEFGPLSVRRLLLTLQQYLLPFGMSDTSAVLAGAWPGPDLILALALAWGLRRPDYLPPLLIGAVFLAADLILQRPPGLWAGLVVLAMELLRARNHLWRDLPFLAEWAVIAAIMTALTFAYWLVLTVLVIRQTGIGIYLIELIETILAYPVVVLFSTHLFGVRTPAPGMMTGLRGRL